LSESVWLHVWIFHGVSIGWRAKIHSELAFLQGLSSTIFIFLYSTRVPEREICTSRSGNLREIRLRSPDSLVLLIQQIPQASRRCTLGGYFHSLKNNPCVFSRLRYSSPVRAILPPNKTFLLCVQ
jgi:hypothetical protein